MLGVFQVFISQSAIFYAQQVSLQVYYKGYDDETKEYILDHIKGPATVWLRIETWAYYSYFISAIAYIIWMSIYNSIKNPIVTDINKQTTDFVEYARINMTWFALNFIKIILPIFLLFGMKDSAKMEIESRKDQEISYKWLMYVCLLFNVVQFLVVSRIFITEYKGPNPEHSP